jgi:AdoMet-dependent heme synthase
MKNITLQSVGWGFGRCNMNCKHCYGASSSSAPEHGFEELKNVADKICPLISSINYGTGEFVFNPNSLELLRYINELYPRVKQAITSNGSTIIMMDPNNLKRFFHDVDISIDYPDPERHNEFRRHPLAWSWVERSLALCRELKIERSIVTCITSQTSDDDIKEFLELAHKFEASWRTNWFRKTGRGKSKLEISATRFWEVVKLLAKLKVEFESMSDPLLASILGRTDKNPTNGCSCGKLSCRIQTDLSVTPCVYLKGNRWSGGSIGSESLETIYGSDTFKSIRNRFPEYCKDCKFGETCRGGCASRAFLHSGGLDKPDNYCPYLSGLKVDELIEEILETKLKIIQGTEKVHDGYLCTMIVR